MRGLDLLVLGALAAAAASCAMPQDRMGSQQAARASQLAAGSASTHSDRLLLTPEDGAHVRQRDRSLTGFRSILNVKRRMRYGEFIWSDQGVPPGETWVRVDLRTQILSVFRAGHEIGTAVVLYGADDKQTPTGVFPVLWKRRDHHSSSYDAPMPYTLRLTGDGISIHGSNVQQGAVTHGCIGVPTEFARRLFEQVGLEDRVVIIRSVDRTSIVRS